MLTPKPDKTDSSEISINRKSSMKDYYNILGIPEDADPDEIKSAFRRLAFQHHPDKNPGNERQAEERFKEINEAYGILGDEARRREYDAFRRGRFAGVGYDRGFQGFSYSQEDIFRNAFSNRVIFEELNRMFAQGGLRFDEDFLNQVFFGERGFHFQFFSGPGGIRQSYYTYGPATPHSTQPMVRKPNFIERMLGKAARKLGKFVHKEAFGIDLGKGEDIHQDLPISSEEAALGCRKRVRYQRGKEEKTIEVTIPPGVVSGSKIKLRGMGSEGMEPGDLYLRIKVK